MFAASCILYLYVETPLHAGSGRGIGSVDLPVQRERVTGYPMVQASGIKGKLRDETKPQMARESWEAIFGPDTDNAPDHAGALSPGDARLLLFPVRSLAGVFAWTTSGDALNRFLRDARAVEEGITDWTVPEEPALGEAWVAASDTPVAVGGKTVVLEEFSYTAKVHDQVARIGMWLAQHALPGELDDKGRQKSSEYDYWAGLLPKHLVILRDNDWRDFVLHATEVVSRVRLDDEKKTVISGALWTEEHLPTDTLLYAPIHASKARRQKKQDDKAEVPASWAGPNGASELLKHVKGLFAVKNGRLPRMQLGGDETVGRGIVALRFGEVH